MRLSRRFCLPALAAITAAMLLNGCEPSRNEVGEAAALPPASAHDAAVPCPAPRADAPILRMLVLGQSNAANHGEAPSAIAPPPVRVQTTSGCRLLAAPLPGGTGKGGSIWPHLASAMHEVDPALQLEFAIIAIDGSSIVDWSSSDTPFADYLGQRLQALQIAAWRPDLVLWQQGEADARDGMGRDDYVKHFEGLRDKLRAQGIDAPMLLANSSYCRNVDGTQIRAAIEALKARHPDLMAGADTDTLQGPSRDGPCHFSDTGLVQAAELWAQAIRRVIKSSASPSPVPATARMPNLPASAPPREGAR